MRQVIGACCLMFLALLLNSGAIAQELLTPHEAQYKVRISVLRGEMNSRLELVDGHYQVMSIVKPKGIARLISRGSIEEHSIFSVLDGLVQPSQYSSSDTLAKEGQTVSMHFDWASDVLTGHMGGQPIELSLASGAIDRASLQYALMVDLMHGRVRHEYILQEPDDIKRLEITLEGEKVVEVPYGRLKAIGITHSANSSSRKTTLWCAPSLGYLPVIIEQYKDGKLKGRVELSSYSLLGGAG